MILEKEKQTPELVYKQFDKGVEFKSGINLYETVTNNENFFIGRQWEGVQSNGLPTPVFNVIRRIILYQVASIASDNIKLSASPLSTSGAPMEEVERIAQAVNAQFEVIVEQNKLGVLSREFARNSAVDGDGCIYSYFDHDIETGQSAKGSIRTELLENTRVVFGLPTCREVQKQPYIIISRRERVVDVRRKAEGSADEIRPDSDEATDRLMEKADDMVTVLTKFWRDEDSGKIKAIETTQKAVVRKEWDTGYKLYPLVWMSWDYVQNCYHGEAAVTGLLPNQIFINKLFAMAMLSIMTTAFPKVVYDGTRIAKWDARVGQSIKVNGGDINNVARAIDPAVISPQVYQFIESAISLTKEMSGATDAALGDTRPDNTSAIIALQKASSVPMELTKQHFYQCIDDMGRIWLDLMRENYGTRFVDLSPTAEELAFGAPDIMRPTSFDFKILNDIPLSLKLDVGGSAYWSEIAQVNTLDNLLQQGLITLEEYLQRMPTGYVADSSELIESRRAQQQMPMGEAPMPGAAPVEAGAPAPEVLGGGGYGHLQRMLNASPERVDISNIQMQ